MYRKIATLPDGGGEVTPIQDIAIETGRPKSSVESKIKELGLKTILVKARAKNAPDGRVVELKAIPSQDVGALIDIVTQMKRYPFASRRRKPNNVKEAAPRQEEPERSKRKASYDRQQALVDLKAAIQLLRDEAGLKSLKWDDQSDGIALRWDRTDVLKV